MGINKFDFIEYSAARYGIDFSTTVCFKASKSLSAWIKIIAGIKYNFNKLIIISTKLGVFLW